MQRFYLAVPLVRNVAWMLAGRWIYNLVTLISFTIIGSIISPADFGVFTLASTFLILSDTFYADAVENLIVKQEGDEATIAPTFFWVSLVYSLALATTIAVIALPFGWFYDNPQVTAATQAIAGIIVVQGSAAVPRALLMRHNRSRQYATNSAAGNLVGAIIGITAALNGFGFWSLILQQACLHVTMLILCSLAVRFHPRAVLDRVVAREFAGNVATMLWSTVLNVSSNRLDVLVVGALFGSTATGLFGLARRLVQIIQDLVASSFDKILLSMVSRQNIRGQSDLIYRSSVIMQGITAIPSFAGFAVIAPILIPRVFGHEWAGAAPLVIYMAGGGVFRSMVTIERARQIAAGQIKTIARVRLYEFGISAVLVAAFAWAGPVWLAATYTVRQLIGYVLVVYSRVGRQEARTLLARTVGWLIMPIAATALMVVTVALVLREVSLVARVEVCIAVSVGIGALTFAGSLYGTRRWWLHHLITR